MENEIGTNRKVTTRPGFIFFVIAIFGMLIFAFTYWGIKRSHDESLELLKQQGAALLESLTLAADNTIKANSFFDLLVQEKFSDLVNFLQTKENLNYTSPELADFSQGYGVSSIMIFDNEFNMQATGSRGVFSDISRIYPIIIADLENLINDPRQNSTFDLIEGDLPGDVSIYYIEKTADREHLIVIVADALFYAQVKENIGIGYLVQNIAREIGIEYILYQIPDGIVFSSKKIGPVLKIEKDPFLSDALTTDTVLSRVYDFNERSILELARKFNSAEYGDGIFRLGISLEVYYDIVYGYDRQMIALSIVIFAVLVLLLLYLSGKQKRIYLNRSFQRIKSLSEKVFDSINAGIVVVNADGNIELANNQFAEILEVEGDRIENSSWASFKYNEIVAFDKIISGEESTGDHETVLQFDSGNKYLLVNTGRFFDQRQKLNGIVAVIYDFTRIRELEETARRKERLTEMGDLAAGVAHEIRNPLNAISIAAQRLLAEFEVKEDQDEFKQFVGQIRSEAGRLNDIVNRFLSMTRGEKKVTGEINLSKVLNETIDFLEYGRQNESIEIRRNIAENIIYSISPDRFKQMVINIVKNSMQALNDSGGLIEINMKVVDSHPVLTIDDNGPGIPDNIREKIFNPYFTTKPEGTGLGLSIVHQIAQELEAEIKVSGRNSGGTSFEIIYK